MASLRIFGSVARSEAGPESDVDLLVEFDRPLGLIGLAGVELALADWHGRSVDLTTAPGLLREYRQRVEEELVRAA